MNGRQLPGGAVRPGGVRILLPLVALLGLLTACAGSPSSSASGSTTSSSSAEASDDELLVELDRGDGTEPERYTLRCTDPADSDHPDAAAACEHLAGLEAPFVPLPGDLACTEQYGGPETAHITGRWNGEPVDLELSRTDGCRISQWESLGPVLPPVEGAVN
jgi:hypothetical protein